MRPRALIAAAALLTAAAPARAQEQTDDVDLQLLEDDVAALRRKMETTMPKAHQFRGYVDVGFFAVGGDGAGIRRDLGHVHFPEFDRVPGSWVFMGDPLSTAVNARGEPADTGPSRAVRLDAIDNGGKPSFVVNTLSVGLLTAVGEQRRITVEGLLDFVPRERAASSPDADAGRFVDIKLAFAEMWLPTDTPIAVYAGKAYSVLGIEYRHQEADRRLGVTPSLVCRYTCGYPTGVGARAALLDSRLTVNGAVTNGSHFAPAFSLSDDIDDNDLMSAAARASWTFDVGLGFEVGASGAIGPQDEQPRNDVLQWHYGLDARLDMNLWFAAAEFVQGDAEGRDGPDPMAARCAESSCMEYKAAYGLAGWRATNWLTPYVRVDWRDALHEHGASFVYISELVRVTGGLHVEVGTNLLIKSEYTWNRELGRIPQFPNDVFANSLVVKY